MTNKIDVHGLPEKDIQLLERMVERLRTKARREKRVRQEDEQEIAFATWPLGLKGDVTREEIYDYL